MLLMMWLCLSTGSSANTSVASAFGSIRNTITVRSESSSSMNDAISTSFSSTSSSFSRRYFFSSASSRRCSMSNVSFPSFGIFFSPTICYFCPEFPAKIHAIMETKPLHPVNPKTPVTTEQIDFGNTHNSSPRSCVLPPVQGVRLPPSYDFDLPLCVHFLSLSFLL